jgi:hypothetical protein
VLRHRTNLSTLQDLLAFSAQSPLHVAVYYRSDSSANLPHAAIKRLTHKTLGTYNVKTSRYTHLAARPRETRCTTTARLTPGWKACSSRHDETFFVSRRNGNHQPRAKRRICAWGSPLRARIESGVTKLPPRPIAMPKTRRRAQRSAFAARSDRGNALPQRAHSRSARPRTRTDLRQRMTDGKSAYDMLSVSSLLVAKLPS